jgi:predicted permease
MLCMEWLESVWSDLRYAFRTLRRRPAFTVVATTTLALGIGATTAMFTVTNGVILRPLPFAHPDRLVRVLQSYPEGGLDTWGLSQPNIVMYRDRATDFEAFTAYRSGSVVVNGDRGPARLPMARVTAPFFDVLGVHPMIGRGFTTEEDAPGKNGVVVLSYGLWQTRFGGSPAVIGSTIDVDGQPARIVGVMPRTFTFPRSEVRLWMPMGLDATRRFGYTNLGIGRLKPGISPAHAERQTTAIMWDWARRTPGSVKTSTDPSKTRMKTIVTPLRDAIAGKTAQPLEVLLAAVSLILLIAIANVATLLTGRAAARQREIALRSALGAPRSRVVRQLLTESVALALLGATLGTALAVVAVRAFTRSPIAALPRLDEIVVDRRVLAFTLAASVVSGVLFGLLPAVHAARVRLVASLGGGARESPHRASRRLNDALAIAQLSLSVILLVAAGLVLESFDRLTRLDLGFRAEGVTSIGLSLPERYNAAPAIAAYTATTLERVRAVPGVKAASLSWGLPFEQRSNVDGYRVEGRPIPPSGQEAQVVETGVSPGHFATLGIPLRYGRDFTPADDSLHTPVAIIDETFARRYWSGTEALGKRVRTTGDDIWFTVVGVVGAVHDFDATEELWPHMYVSIPQQGGLRLSLAVRTTGASSSVIPAVRQALRQLDPAIPLDDPRTLESIVGDSFATRRLAEVLLIGFSLLAVVLAGVGVYGVMSASVAGRAHEFGIRLAIGADPGGLVRHVLGEGARLAAIGTILGLAGAAATTRWLGSLLFEVSPTDPVVYGTLALVLAAIAVAACWAPARRAAKNDPVSVLRG